jgi:hypothetical protein
MRTRDRLLRRLSRALPKEFRERVFEPAFSDILLEDNAPRPFARAVLILECLRLGVPEHFWRKGRPTLGAVTLVVVLVLGALVSARLRYAADWRREATSTDHRSP